MAEGTKKGFGETVKQSVKDVVPKTTGGKVVGAIGTAIVSVGSFFIGRLSKGGKKSK